MDLLLKPSVLKQSCHISISGSKSETNRLLLLKALYPEISIENISDSDDADVMRHALTSGNDTIDVHHAGTAMRFLTAYFATQPNREIILTGSERMKQRPIKILVEALRSLGAKIEYVGNVGYPPLKINGVNIQYNEVSVNANVSSQYITSLLLIGASLKNGLTIKLEGDITSQPYINMTTDLLQQVGITVKKGGSHITVSTAKVLKPVTITVESDWSSASYYYSLVALAKESTEVSLSFYKKNSLQGDSALIDIYRQLGVETVFEGNTITLIKTNSIPEAINLDLNNTPDIAQTVAVTCFGLGEGCTLTGLHTLKIKETDRLEALRNELSKLGARVSVTNDSLKMLPALDIKPDVAIETYNDHRMAMAFAPLALKTSIIIKNAEVVSKSYPSFWKDFNEAGIVSKEL